MWAVSCCQLVVATVQAGPVDRFGQDASFSQFTFPQAFVALNDRTAGPQVFALAFKPGRRDDVESVVDQRHRGECGWSLRRESSDKHGELLFAREEHFTLVGEVPEERARRQARAGGDLRDGRREALFGEQFHGSPLQLLASIRFSSSHLASLGDGTVCHRCCTVMTCDVVTLATRQWSRKHHETSTGRGPRP